MMHGCSCRVDAARNAARRRQERREGKPAFVRHIRAHQSVVEDWTRHRDDRPEGVREEVWCDPLYTPDSPATEQEARFLQTRRLRRRQLRLWGDDA